MTTQFCDSAFSMIRYCFNLAQTKSRKQLRLLFPHSQLTSRFARNTFHMIFCVFFLRVWVAEAVRIVAQQVGGAMALEEHGLSPQSAIDILTKSIHLGEEANVMASSLVNLSLFLEEGHDGVQKDLGRAGELYSRAIDEGDSTHAMWRLANLLCPGEEGVEKDINRAVQLYNRAVDGGNVEAMFELGNVLAEGSDDIEKDVVRAGELYSRATNEGGHAMSNLADLLEAG